MTKYLFLILVLLSSCASPEQLINRALKKDPEVLKKRMSAEVVYVTDTVPVYLDGEVVEVPVSVPVEKTVIKWVTKRTSKEERIAARLQKEQLNRYKLVNDSLHLNNKKLKQEARLLRSEVNLKNRESFTELIIFIKDNVLSILIYIFVFYFLIKIIKWARNEYAQKESKL